MLAEESPARLLTLFGTETLEEAFLILSRNQEEGRINSALDAANRLQGNAILESASSTTSIATFDIAYGSKDVSFFNKMYHCCVENTNTFQELTPTKKRTKIKKDQTSLQRHRIKALLDKNWKQFYRNVT